MSAQSILFDAPGPRARARYRFLGAVGGLVLLGIAALIIYGLREQFAPEMWQPIFDPITWTAYLLPGLWMTIQAAAIAVVTSGILGFALALGRLTHIRWLSWLCGALVEFFRAVPVLMMMLFWYFLLRPVIKGDALALTGVVMGLTLYNSAVIAELIRAGVGSLPKGQREAGLALGLTRGQTMRSILVPQAVTAMLPALVSQLVVVLKDAALGYLIGYSELIRAAQNLATVKGNIIVAFGAAALMFIVINGGLTALAHLVERKVRTRTSGDTVVKMNVNVPGATETHAHDAPAGTHGLQ